MIKILMLTLSIVAAVALFDAEPAEACTPPSGECQRGVSVEKCIQASRAARARFEACRDQERSSGSAARQMEFDRRSEEVKSRQRKMDEADAQRRAREDRERLDRSSDCGSASCNPK